MLVGYLLANFVGLMNKLDLQMHSQNGTHSYVGNLLHILCYMMKGIQVERKQRYLCNICIYTYMYIIHNKIKPFHNKVGIWDKWFLYGKIKCNKICDNFSPYFYSWSHNCSWAFITTFFYYPFCVLFAFCQHLSWSWFFIW